MRWVVVAMTSALLASLPSPATADSADAPRAPPESQANRWLVIPALDDASTPWNLESLHGASEALRQELVVRGESAWRADLASERFEVLGSAPAPTVSQSDIDRWVERSRAAVRYLARADYRAAHRELRAAQRLADRAAEELNREAARAQQVLDTCLFMVRAYLETKNTAEARRQARECRQLVPRIEPTAFRHTPEVRELLAAVDAEIAAEGPGSLDVTSTPSGCAVRVNGVQVGKTPLLGVELPVGTYRLQVECTPGERGRIHRVAVQGGHHTFDVDGTLDTAVGSRPVLHLAYETNEAWADRMRHGLAIAGGLGGAPVLVLTGTQDGLRLDASPTGGEPASVWIPAGPDAVRPDDVRRAVDAVLEGRSVDFTAAHPWARPSWKDEAESAAASTAAPLSEEPAAVSLARPRPQRIAGWSLFGAGVASIGASIGLHVHRGTLGDRLVEAPANIRAADDWNDARIGVWATAAFGGAATTAAMPLLLPNYPRTPWWGWLSGALGLGLAGYAIYEGVTMTGCTEPFLADEAATRSCVARGEEAGRIALSLAGAAPLLTVPLVYLFRPLRAEPSVSVRSGGAVVRLRKAF